MPNNNRLQAIWLGLASNSRWSEFIVDEDIKSFNRRMESEGPEFYARDLSKLRTSILTAFDSGKFEKCGRFGSKRNSVLPRWLYKAFSAVFSDTGEMHCIPDVDAVACLNQLTAVFGKLKGGHTPQSEIDTIQAFINTEREIESTTIDMDTMIGTWYYDSDGFTPGKIPLAKVLDSASLLVRRVLCGSDPREISPKHGSGVSACGTKVRYRYATPRFIKSIDKVWPMSEWYYASPTAFCDGLGAYLKTPDVTPCAKVLLVPKDAKGPRLISCEPKETMWIQQGLMASMYEAIEEHPLTRGSVNFTNQWFNQVAAYVGSGTEAKLNYRSIPFAIKSHYCPQRGRFVTCDDCEPNSKPPEWKDFRCLDSYRFGKIVERRHRTAEYLGYPDLHQETYSRWSGNLATLDLKDASDRLRLDIVNRLFPENWVEALNACRSGETVLPNGELVTMRKHAPMGSATCFPVMALTIWSLLTAIAPSCDKHRILVYGDDIIVPTYMVESAIAVLTAVGLMVNRNKSFSKGPFRESCGEEYFLGVRVTPIRLRKYPDDDVESLMSCMAFGNNMLECPYITDNGWFIQLVKEWYGNSNVPVLLRRTKTHSCRWSSTDQKLILQRLRGIRVVTQSGVLYTDSPLLVNLPDGRRKRFNSDLQRYEYKLRLPVPETEKFGTGDWCHVLRALVVRLEQSELGFDVVHNRVRYVRRWVSV